MAHAREPRRVREPHRRARELVAFPPREKNAGRAQKVLYDPGAMVSPHDCWCGLCRKLLHNSKLAMLSGGYTAHMTKHHKGFKTILNRESGDVKLRSLESDDNEPNDNSSAGGGGSSAVATPALRSYTAQEVRDEYMCVPDAATLAAPGTPESPGYGLRSEDAVYEDVPEAPARRRR